MATAIKQNTIDLEALLEFALKLPETRSDVYILEKTLIADNWVEDTSDPEVQSYTYSISSSLLSPKTIVDIQPEAKVLQELRIEGVQCIYARNNNGSIGIIVIGEKPKKDITLQITFTETEESIE